MASQAAVLSILVRANTQQAMTGLLRVNQSLVATEKTSKKTTGVIERGANKATYALESLAKIVAIGGGVTVAAGFAYSVKKAADFEQQLSSLGSVADASAKQMDRLRRQALRAGADTKFSALDAAAAQTELAKGGLSVQQIMRGGLRSALALAAAGEMDLADAAEATVNAMKLFGLRGKDSMKVADAFATAANRTTADVSDFALALKMGGSAAKASGLNFIQTTAILEALAEVGIKGSDAGTSMKAALTQLAAPTKKSAELMDKMGLKFFDAKGNMKGVTEISGMLRSKLGGLSNEQRLATIKTIAGTDGMRALLAMYDAGPKKMERFQKDLGKQGTAADVAKKKQDNLAGSVEQLQGSLETLAIQIGSAALPLLKDLADEATDLANDISKIVARDDLDLGEKLSRIFDVAEVKAKPWIDKLKAAIEQADIPKKIADLISAATPIIAGAAAKAAGTAAAAFVRAFGEADVWGKLVIGGWLLAKMGGPKAFRKLGVVAGAEMGRGMAVGAATTGAVGAAAGGAVGSGTKGAVAGAAGAAAGGASGTFAKSAAGAAAGAAAAAKSRAANLTSAAKGVAPAFLALKVATDFLKDKSDLGLLNQYAGTIERVAKTGDTAGMTKLADQMRATAQANSDLTKGKHLNLFADALEQTAANGGRDLSGLRDAFARMAKSSGGDLERLRGEFAKTSDQIPASAEKIRETTKDVRRLFNHMAGGVKPDMEHISNAVRINAQRIKESLGKKTREGKDALQLNIDLAVKAISRGMKKGSIAADEGMREIRRLFVKALALYGLSPEHARGRDPVSGQLKIPKKDRGNRQFQRGGPIDMGAPSGDTVPAMLERGEYVVNRRAVRKVGRKALDQLNFGAAPRFQSGGIVALGRQLQQQGYAVGEHPAFGGVGGHTPGSYHYKGMALDVNADNWPGGEAGALDKLYARLKGMPGIVELLWRVAGHFDHLHVAMSGAVGPLGMLAPKLARVAVSGPESMLKSVVQGALDKVHGAAQQKLDTSAAGPGGGSFSPFSGAWTDMMGTIAGERGWNLGDWQRLVQKESGGDPTARNPTSGAFGLGQFLGATAKAYAKHGALSSDPVDQIRAMAQYISDRYGNPSSALAFHDANNWYAAGGPVGKVGQSQTGLGKGMAGSSLVRRFGLEKTLKKVASKNRAVRGPAVRKMLDQIKGVGLPKSLAGDLERLATDADVFGDYANRASQLTGTDSDGNVLTEGLVGDKSQSEWLQAQLKALFEWRNRIIEAEKIIVEKRRRIAEMIDRAREELARVREQVRSATSHRDGLQKQLEQLEKKPKRNKAAIKLTRERIAGLDDQIRIRSRVRDTLKDKILPSMVGQRSALNTARGTLLTNLDTVQGAGSTTGILSALPALGVLGGRIFDTQITLRDLTGERARVTDVGAGSSERESILSDLLRESNLRTAVSEAQFKVFKGMGPFGGSFATGGVVPGSPGAPRVIQAHGGEGVFTPDQMAAMGGGAGQIVVIVQDGAVREDKIRVLAGQEAEAAMRRVGRTASRGLPGRGGGGLNG